MTFERPGNFRRFAKAALASVVIGMTPVPSSEVKAQPVKQERLFNKG